ncbi:MAG: hypothetical protein V1872_11695 [bacterium]
MEEKIQELIKKFKEYKADGKLGALDIFRFIVDCVTELACEVEEFTGKPGTEKKTMVISALEDIYIACGLDIPCIPNFLERTLLFKYIIPAIIDGVVVLLNKKGVFKHEQGVDCHECGLTSNVV